MSSFLVRSGDGKKSPEPQRALPDKRLFACVRHDKHDRPKITVASPPYLEWETVVDYDFRQNGPCMGLVGDKLVTSSSSSIRESLSYPSSTELDRLVCCNANNMTQVRTPLRGSARRPDGRNPRRRFPRLVPPRGVREPLDAASFQRNRPLLGPSRVSAKGQCPAEREQQPPCW
jgi:hypothetical protein